MNSIVRTLARNVRACAAMQRRIGMTHSFNVSSQSRNIMSVNLARSPKIMTNKLLTTSTCNISSVNCPPLGDSVLEGDVVEWKVNVGDWVNEDDVLLVLETAKVVIEIPSPFSGVLTAQHLKVGDVANVGDKICDIDSDAPKPEGSAKPAPKADAPKADAPKSNAPKADVPKSSSSKTEAPSAQSASSSVSTSREDRRVKMTRMRQTIAKRLKDSQNTMAMLTTFNEIDMTAAMNLRSEYKDNFEKKHGVKLGFMSLFMKASAQALKAFPDVNAYIDAETNEIVYRNYADISIAVATPTGLVVPVVRDVQDKNFADLEKSVQDYANKARNGTISMDDFVGGTFTISNGGVYGSLFGTPIINPPQSAILGMHSIVKRPIAVGDNVQVRPMMYVALTYDHRLLDGSTAVQFLKHIKSSVEDPRAIILDM